MNRNNSPAFALLSCHVWPTRRQVNAKALLRLPRVLYGGSSGGGGGIGSGGRSAGGISPFRKGRAGRR